MYYVRTRQRQKVRGKIDAKAPRMLASILVIFDSALLLSVLGGAATNYRTEESARLSCSGEVHRIKNAAET